MSDQSDYQRDIATVKSLLERYSIALSVDLTAAAVQQVHTTKFDRRMRAVAYLIETLTSNAAFVPSEKQALDMLHLVDSLRSNAAGANEATVALERAEKRIRWALDHQTIGLVDCVACGEQYVLADGNHVCTNRFSKAKDSMMARDPDVML